MGKSRDTANLISDGNISVDIVNDRVGIGSTLPGYKLDVGGNINFSGNLYQNGSVFTSGVGIQSAGTVIGTGVTTLNFVGSGNTFAVNGSTVDISISGGGGGATGFGTNKVFYENDTTVTGSYSITAGKNAMSAGPIQIGVGATVTIPSGSVWTIV